MDASRLERAARALLRVVDERDPGLRGYYIDAERFSELRAALAAPEPASAEAVARDAAREAVRLADSDRGDGATSMSEEAIINRAVAHALRAKGAR